jgi:hypothetical protein
MQRRRLAAVALALAGALAGDSVQARQAPLEYDVKAAFLLNFARYVGWPAAQRPVPFQLCVLGQNPFGRRLEEAIAGEAWNGRPMRARDIQDVREARDCHLLYVPAAATDRFIASSAQLARRPVLTVGETREFLQKGMIQLFIDGNKVRFSINQGAADDAQLQISSRLLRLAREIVSDMERRP